MADGFLNRWSRRKLGVESETAPDLAQEANTKVIVPEPVQAKNAESDTVEVSQPEQAQPTIDDAEKMDRFAPDFSAFMKPNVDPAVQQAAMKKLFSDPHFNIMDRLDIYIDDYSIPDPIPMEMLKRMVQSESLGLFRTFEEGPGAKVLAETKEEKALEPEPTATAELNLDQVVEGDAANTAIAQDEVKHDLSVPDSEQTLVSLDNVPKQKIE